MDLFELFRCTDRLLVRKLIEASTIFSLLIWKNFSIKFCNKRYDSIDVQSKHPSLRLSQLSQLSHTSPGIYKVKLGIQGSLAFRKAGEPCLRTVT